MNYCLFLCQLILIYSILLLGSSTHKFKLLYCSLRSEISISFSFFHFWLQHPGNGSKGILSSSFKSKLSEIMIIIKNAKFFPDKSTREPPPYSGSKSCEGFKVLPCLQTHRLACTVLAKVAKGTGFLSQIQRTSLQHGCHRELCVCLSSPYLPDRTAVTWRWV